VVLLPPDSPWAVSGAGAGVPLLDAHQSDYSPWEDSSAEVSSVVLRGGQVLLVPRGWWVTARALCPSLSVAFALGRDATVPAAFELTPEALRQATVFSQSLGDLPVAAKVLRPGGGPPVPGVKRVNAVCHYELYSDGRLVRSTRSHGPEALSLGVDPNLGKLDEAVRALRVGDRALIALPGPRGNPTPTHQACGSALVFDLELLAVNLPAAAATSSTDEYNARWMTWFDRPDKWRPLLTVPPTVARSLCPKAAVARMAAPCRSTPAHSCAVWRQQRAWPARRLQCREVD